MKKSLTRLLPIFRIINFLENDLANPTATNMIRHKVNF